MMRTKEPIGAVILAAGSSSRLGVPKQLLTLNGETLLCKTISAIRANINGPIVVVTGHDSQAIKQSSSIHERTGNLTFIHCISWNEGMGTSLACGVKHLTKTHPNLLSILISVCDQPYLTAHVIENLLTIHRSINYETVASEYSNTVGPPALFTRRDFSSLKKLEGNKGAKSVLTNRSKSVEKVPFPLGSVDIDIEEDLDLLHATRQSNI